MINWGLTKYMGFNISGYKHHTVLAVKLISCGLNSKCVFIVELVVSICIVENVKQMSFMYMYDIQYI